VIAFIEAFPLPFAIAMRRRPKRRVTGHRLQEAISKFLRDLVGADRDDRARVYPLLDDIVEKR
jgi:hypothetical protein